MESVGEDKRVLQLGGLGGLLAGALFIVAIVTGFALLPPVAGAEEAVMGYPERRAGFTVFAGLALVAAILVITVFLALYRALRRTSLASALLGSVLGVLGLVVIAFAFGGTFVTFPALSDLYHAPGATPEEQATIVLLWQGTQGIFGAAFFVGNLFPAIGFISLGVAMLGSPHFRGGFGGASMVLGAAGVVGAFLSPIVSGALFVGPIAAITFALLMGGKLYSLSRAA